MGKRGNRERKAQRALGKAPTMTPGAVSHPLVGPDRAPTGQLSRYDPRNPAARAERIGMTEEGYNDKVRSYVLDTIANLDTGNNWFSPFQPVTPFGPPGVDYPRTFDYKTGINLDFQPSRINLMHMLRSMSRSWGLLRTVIETRKDQFMRMPAAFQIKGAPKKKNKRIDELKEFFQKPDGKHTFTAWRRKLLEDMLVIDAATVFKWKSIAGPPVALEVLDGATIKPLIDDAGRRPDAPSPAFQQIIKGLPMTNWTEDDLRYMPMRPLPDMPIYGYSPVEQILGEVTAGIKRLSYQISFWTEGSMPELIVTMPKEWTPSQIAQYQAMFDALMSGNIPLKSKIRFMPGDTKPFDIKNANGDALKADIDEWWARLVCYAFGVSPQPFIRMMNRSTAQTAQAQAEEEGLHPVMLWFKEEVMDPIIQQDFGFDEIEYAFLPNPEVDQTKQMTILTGYVKEGILARGEAREELGVDRMPGDDVLTVDTPNGPMPMKEWLEANRQKSDDMPNELQRTQEMHDAEVLATKAKAKQKAKPPAKGVGKAADAPFLEAGGRPAGTARVIGQGRGWDI